MMKMELQWKILLLLASCLALASGEAPHHETMLETLPLYTVISNNDLLNETQCKTEMQTLLEAVDTKKLWGIRMLDVSGQPGPGFTVGNNFWSGSRVGCTYINEKREMPLSMRALRNASQYRDPKYEYPPYQVQYYVARFIHNSTQQYHMSVKGEDRVILGLCLPSSCTENEISVIMEKIFHDRTLLSNYLYSADYKLYAVSNLTDDYKWLLDGPKIIILLILFITVNLTLIGTVYDVMIFQRRFKKKRDFLAFENNNTAEMKNDVEAKHEPDPETTPLESYKPKTATQKVLLCFSAYTNAKSIFNFDSGAETVSAIHGMKFLSMAWIIVGHSAYYSNNYIANVALGIAFTNASLVQIISNATYSVDTFFCVSGFLLGYLYFKLTRKEKKPVFNMRLCVKTIILPIINRYIRLTPAYLIVILLAILNFTWYDKVAMHTDHENPSYYCSKYWWRNLLYINNLFEWEELCLSWSWYVSNDMQFFLFGTILLLLFTWWAYVAIGVACISLLLTFIITGYTVYTNEYVPAIDDAHRTLSFLYMRPWIRSGPYLIGLGTAVLLEKWNYNLNLSTKAKMVGWAFGILCNGSILFGVVDKNLTPEFSILYTSLTRTCWGLGISWVILACSTNNGGIVNKILSFPIWIPLSRLTLGAYLLNPFLIHSLNLFNNYPHFFEILNTGCLALGMLVVTYICSIGLSLVAEAPAIRLLRLVFNRRKEMK
ncbi:nose resistant to fluoxetine protein 6 [Nomia melanderi]|uniref:nose resistant to fluoxetine protein 6 n=1 Tax=Nomia melanderi TaxID=2448451 RepID=UPI0013043AF1|nr:nose resistant to fluoxetine protein 6-like [Nomia melanderi]